MIRRCGAERISYHHLEERAAGTYWTLANCAVVRDFLVRGRGETKKEGKTYGVDVQDVDIRRGN